MTPELHPVTPEALHKLLTHDPDTGKLFWKRRHDPDCDSWNKQFAFAEAFTNPHSKGYLAGAIFGRTYLAHRVIFALHYGYWPEITDHINGVRTDNRICNLRSVTPSENQRNRRISKNNKSGFTGVHASGEKWVAQINRNYKYRYLGRFSRIEDAVAARKEAERKYDFHIYHSRIA